MTNGQYTLVDEEFARFASIVNRELGLKNIQHVIVGNVAVQAHVLNLMSKRLKTSIPELARSQELSAYLRPTSTLDVAILPQDGVERKVIEAQEKMAECTLDFDGNRMFDYRLSRSGAKRATFGVEDLGHSTQSVALKLIYGANDMNGFGLPFYGDSVQDVRNITLPFGKDRDLPLKVMAPLYLFAAKTDRLEPQDLGDIGSLAFALNRFGKGVNQAELRTLLGEQYRANFEVIERSLGLGKTTA